MDLYPTILFDPVSAALDPNRLPSGMLALMSINLAIVQMTQIVLSHVSYTQDYSLRLWFSEYPNGLPIAGIFPMLRNGGLPFVVYVASCSPPTNTIPILIESGQYVLNILNLSNEENMFTFSKTDLA